MFTILRCPNCEHVERADVGQPADCDWCLDGGVEVTMVEVRVFDEKDVRDLWDALEMAWRGSARKALDAFPAPEDWKA